MSSKPSAPVTLFDFLAKSNKIPVGSKENKGTWNYRCLYLLSTAGYCVKESGLYCFDTI